MRLTAEGEEYFRTLRQAFDLLRAPARAALDQPPRMRIGCFPFLASEVIVARLGELKRALSGIDITLREETRLGALLDAEPASRLDVLIRYGTGRFPGFVSVKLSDVELVPITAIGATPIESAEDLLSRPIIRVLGPFNGWKAWAAGQHLDAEPANVALETDSYHAAALAVERGVGIGVGLLPFLWPWLRAQRVRMVAPLATPIDQAAYLVYAAHSARIRSIPRLHGWLSSVLA